MIKPPPELLSALESNPDDHLLKCVIGDWVGEYNSDEGAAWRWLGEEKRTPYYYYYETGYFGLRDRRWCWNSGPNLMARGRKFGAEVKRYAASSLPATLFSLLVIDVEGDYRDDLWRRYTSLERAWSVAVEAVIQSRSQCEVVS